MMNVYIIFPLLLIEGMEHQLIPVAADFVQKHHFEISKSESTTKVIQSIALHIDALIYNVASLACVVSMLYDHTKITPKHLVSVRKYIQDKCTIKHKSQRGGMSMASDFYGYPHPAYSDNAMAGSTVVSTINFAEGLARPALGPVMMGGAQSNPAVIQVIHKAIKKVLKHHERTISKNALEELIHIIHIHLDCFAKDLAAEAPLTETRVKKVIEKKRHAIFQ